METLFNPVSALLGGAMIGVSALLLLGLNGRIAGISGIVGGALSERGGERYWRLAFLGGLLLGGGIGIYAGLLPAGGITVVVDWKVMVAAGLLVGYGTRLGGGCTSGHGVCGIGRLSVRSVVGTVIFMLVAAIAVFVQRHLVV